MIFFNNRYYYIFIPLILTLNIARCISPPYNGGPIPKIIGLEDRVLDNIDFNENELKRFGSAAPPYPPSDYNLLVLLINFSDQSIGFSRETFQNHLFGDVNTGPNTGSLIDYYDEVSYGKFNLSGDVYGPYTSSKSESETYDEEGINPYKISDYITSALQEADNDGVDFTKYDNDDDGYVDVIMIVYPGAGGDQGSFSTIGSNEINLWPHMATLSHDPDNDDDYEPYNITFDGVAFSKYIICPEKTANANSESDRSIRPIGVYAHEFGHALGLPDLYDRTPSGDADSDGLGYWCLMAAGSHNGTYGDIPAHMSAWCKYRLGWIDPILLKADTYQNNLSLSGKLELHNVAANDNQVYKIYADTYQWNEYFLLENRQLVNFDSEIPGSGLMIYHIDENRTLGSVNFSAENSSYGPINDNYLHKLVDIEEADGENDLDVSEGYNSGDSGDPYPGSEENFSFTSSTIPNNYNYGGYSSSVELYDIENLNYVVSMELSIPHRDGQVLAYDEGGWLGWTYSPCAVKFTAPGNVFLNEIDIAIFNDATDIYITIYRSMSGGFFSDNEENVLLETTSYNNLSQGWNTLDISPIEFDSGEAFYIEVSSDNGGAAYLLSDTSTESNNSYYKNSNGGYNTFPKNFCIRSRFDSDGEMRNPLPELPRAINIDNAYPNPFNPIINLSYSVSYPEMLSVNVYNINGEFISELTNSFHVSGNYDIIWDASNISSGIYFIKYLTESNSFTQKVTLIK